MVAGVAAVIAVTRGNVIIVGVKPYRTVAHAGIEGEFVRQLPLGLQIRVDVPHQITFITAQVPLFAVLRRAVDHHEVFKPFAPLAHVFIVETGGEGDRHQQFAAMSPAGIEPLIVARQVDNAARVRGVELRRAWD